MRKGPEIAALLASGVLLLVMAGCTVYPDKTATVKTTTSAEQLERLSWQMTKKQQWSDLEPLLAANVVWTLPGKKLDREQILSYLKTLNLSDYTIRDLSVKPNGPDMTISYTLQVSAAGAGNVEYSVVSIWQQVKGGQILILRSELPANVTANDTKTGL